MPIDREPELPNPEFVIFKGVKEKILILAETIQLNPDITKGDEASRIKKLVEGIELEIERLSNMKLTKAEILKDLIDQLVTERPEYSFELAKIGKDLFKF